MAEICVLAALKALSSASARELATAASGYLAKQVLLIYGVQNEIDSIKTDLQSIQGILRFADQQMEMSGKIPMVGEWVEKVRDVAYKVEDILDNHMYGIADRGGGIGAFHGVVNRSKRKFRKLATYRETAAELERIKPSVKEIVDIYNKIMSSEFSLLLHGSLVLDPISGVGGVGGTSGASSSRQHRISSTNNMFSEDNVFFSKNERGVAQKDIVEGLIMEELPKFSDVPTNNFDTRWKVIAVCGMGGVGKTTLIRQIYRNNTLREQFDICVWVTVSKTYESVELLRNMSKQLEGIATGQANIDTMNAEELLRRIHQKLGQKRYLIVFDDVWNRDFWSKIGTAFRKDDDRRSRILITTRDERVAKSLAVEDRIISLAPLQEGEAWSLFCNRTFWQDPMPKCPSHLEYWARKIVRKCGGLPLAIVAASGMMSIRKREVLTWERSYKILSLDLGNDPDLNVLMHSYYDLPSCLKQCFLYCSLFPEDHIVVKEDIIRLWVAEGFIEEKNEMTLEEVAEDYLQELVERSMIQVVYSKSQKNVDGYRIHDTLRMIALKVSGGQKFSTIVDEEYNPKDARRLSILKRFVHEIPSEINLSHLRSLFSFGSLHLPFSFSELKLLRVLDLRSFSMWRWNITEYVFELFNLRYLGLPNLLISEKIERLQQLQTLSIYLVHGEQLPHNVVKLQKLRHICLGYRFEAPAGIWHLKNLQTLHSVRANEELVEHLGQLTNLRMLGIDYVKESHGRPLCSSLERMERLQVLCIGVHDGHSINMEHLNRPPPHLQELVWLGRLASIPIWFYSIRKLILREDICNGHV